MQNKYFKSKQNVFRLRNTFCGEREKEKRCFCDIIKVMPTDKNNKNSDCKIKEVASKLDISEATVRKYLRDFGLETQGTGNKTVVTEETFKALSEIVKLRANGLSIQEIKELRNNEPAKTILKEIEEEDEGIAPTEEKDKSKLAHGEELVKDAEAASNMVQSGFALEDLKGEKSDLIKEEEVADEAADEEASEEEIEEDLEGEAPQERRRRLFNYRYVERQISNDSKKIAWLKQRLRNPNISPQDKLYFEESLERRLLFLDGWKHILKWVSSQ